MNVLCKFKHNHSLLFLDDLNGGEKNIVFLIFYISLKNFHQASFYVFGELDINFDSVYNFILIYLFKIISTFGKQVFSLYFKKNFVNCGDKWFDIINFNNRENKLLNVSKLRVID